MYHSPWREEELKNHILMGKTLTGVLVSDDRESIGFSIQDSEPIIAEAYGDCCSFSWIESVEFPALGFPALVTKVEDLELPTPGVWESPSGYPQECLAVYGLKIETDKGEIIIDFRNESNGYYGGSLEFPPRAPDA